jgi:hypothetical protein
MNVQWQVTRTRGLRARNPRVGVCASPTNYPARASDTPKLALTFTLDHSVGADHSIGLSRPSARIISPLVFAQARARLSRAPLRLLGLTFARLRDVLEVFGTKECSLVASGGGVEQRNGPRPDLTRIIAKEGSLDCR